MLKNKWLQQLISTAITAIILWPGSLMAQQKPQPRRQAVATTTNAPIIARAEARLAYKVEVTEQSAQEGQVVVLAVGSVTAFKCPETPTQVVKGRPEVLQEEESTEGLRGSVLYIKPTMANVRTNLFLEMPSGAIDIQVKTIAITGGAEVGDYHGEVLIKTAKYRDELSKVEFTLAGKERELADLKEQLKASEEKQAKGSWLNGVTGFNSNQGSNNPSSLFDGGVIEALVPLLERQERGAPLQLSGITVYQLGKARKVGSEWVVLLLAQNETKLERTISTIAASNGAKVVISSLQSIKANSEARLVLRISTNSESSALGGTNNSRPEPQELTLTSGLVSGKLRLRLG